MIDNYPNKDVKKQKIVLVAEFFDKKINATGLYWHQIALSLSKNYQVIIVSPNVNKRLSNLGCEVRAFPSRFNFLKKLVPEKLYTTLIIYLVLLKTPLKESKVLIGTNPLFLPLAVPLIKLLRPKEINLICYDLFPQNLILQSNFFLKVFLYFVSKFYLISYRMLDKIIVVGRDMARKVAELKFHTYCQVSKRSRSRNFGVGALKVVRTRVAVVASFPLRRTEEGTCQSLQS